ncbi:GldG family protein [Paenibacillus sp. CC-CFT747]|nr:GldG family protein [Paenibacillus sp. CC-CFT747]
MKNWIKGTNAVVLSLAVVGIFIVLTVFLHSLKGTQWDLTKNKKFTLSDQTVTMLQKLDKPVHVTAFSDPGQGVVSRQITDLLQEYHKRNNKFTFEEVDPKQKPTLAEKYKIDRYGTIVFEMDGQTKNVYADELYASGAAEGSYTFSGEEKFTQAVLSLTSKEKHTVYFLTGHGEMTSANASAFRSSLESEGYTVKDLNLVKEAAIPADAETLFILGPQNDLSEAETKLVQDYVKDKGKLMFALGLAKDMDQWKNWDAVLASVGVKNVKALAVENKKSLSTDPLTIVPEYGAHTITDKLSQQDRITVMPGALALAKDGANADFTATALLHTSTSAYGKTNINELLSKRLTTNDIKQADQDVKGPLDLAYAVENKDGKPKAVVIGNGTFLTNDWLTQQGNRDFVLNSVGWLQEQKNAVTIRPQEEAQMQQVVLTPAQGKTILIGTVGVIPALFLLAGGLIWWRRRAG